MKNHLKVYIENLEKRIAFFHRLSEAPPLNEFLRFCPYMVKYGSVFYPIWTECVDLQCKSPYSVQLHKTMDQKNSECEHFLRYAAHSIDWNIKKHFLIYLTVVY